MSTGLEHAAGQLQQKLGGAALEVGVVLGSGLGGLVDELEHPVSIAFGELPGWPLPGVLGHQGAFVAGRLAGRHVLVQCGRYHLYEGFSPAAVVRPVRLMGNLGLRAVLFTNAAGAINRRLVPGSLMLVADQINLTARNGLVGPAEIGEVRFPDMSAPCDAGLAELARRTAREQGIALEEGVYAGVTGPNYETKAEIRMLERMGADAVGMSTVLEVIAARALGLRCLVISTITNLAAGLGGAPLNHREVLETGARARGTLLSILAGVVAGA
ncbi:MAG TPA: purine-nucleoside phosphorylase [Gemmatimonadales bacterium]|nr:purine-nucleoside phosphorylase [Gemmatimonadales bacterium]